MDEIKIIKCKTCGEALDIRTAKDGVIECKYCATVYTLPKEGTTPEVLSYLRMGEHDLDTCNWDGAMAAYKKACEKDSGEPEAFWGLALASYKVQYVKDVVNNRLQPICHEISTRKFSESKDYIKALSLATPAQKAEYERKAAEIDYIKDEFYKLSQSGLDYDCFICVKVTDENGGKTEDFKDAEYIYDLLKNKGYAPFFSERSIRNRTGADYEAMILYALYSSETMLVVCRNEDYLQTPWVKNEYTRFLRLVNDEEKESDSITFVYYEKPIDRLPGRAGKLQGIDFSRRDADGRIIDFVEKHTPQAKAKREEAKRRKEEEVLAQAQKLKELEEQYNKLNSVSNLGGLSMEELLAKMESARMEKERKAAEDAYKKAEEQARTDAEFRRIWQIENGILKNYKGEGGYVVVPDAVTGIGEDVFRDCENLTNIIFHNKVTSICKGAFSGCGLTDIIIPEGVKEISEKTFEDCTQLKSVILPYGITSIGSCAFSGCSSLTSITIPNSVAKIGENAFDGCNSLSSESRKQIEQLAEKLKTEEDRKREEIEARKKSDSIAEFKRQSSIEDGVLKRYRGQGGEVVIPDDITSIASCAFASCKSLTSITIPDSVESICDQAFYGCIGLKNVTISNGLKSIGTWAFMGCSNLNSITIPDGVTSIGDSAFEDCSALENVKIPKSVTNIGKCAFRNCRSLKNIVIPDGVTSIGNCMFDGCGSLKSIKIPDSVTSIYTFAFNKCISLTSITIPKGVTKIGSCAFMDCYSLIEVKNLSSLNITAGSYDYGYVGRYAKSVYKTGDSYLFTDENGYMIYDDGTNKILVKYTGTDTVLTLPGGITQINRGAFYGCSDLKCVTMPKGFKGRLKDIFPKEILGMFGKCKFKFI